MIKAIFFDFDGVLALEYGGGVAIARHLSQKLNIPFDTVFTIYVKYGEQLVLTHSHFGTILEPLNQDLGSSLTLDDITEATKTATPNSEMLALANELRHNEFMTGVITDNNIDRIEILAEPFGLHEFKPLVVSANVGAGKWQDATIFNVALSESGVKANESVFIDNSKNNLIVPKELGMHTYWHNDESNDVAALRSWLLQLGIKIQ